MYNLLNKRELKAFVSPLITLSLLCSSSMVFAADYPVLQMIKRNAEGYAIDGNNGGENAQNVYLWSEDSDNVNQQWYEIDRGDDYYSYQKVDTEYCLDGDNGGENTQNVYLWSCQESNYNQHWLKVDMGDGYYRLEKRNASDYSIDGNNGGENSQSIYLWESSDSNENQHWYFNYISGNDVSETPVIASVFDDGTSHSSYPATNVIDGDTSFASRWAASGSPVNLTIQLEEVSVVSEVGIAWGRGDSRSYTFEIYARADTSGSWTRVFNGVSSGNTADIEFFDVTDIDAQQIRIKTSANSAGTDWTDITEVSFSEESSPSEEEVNSRSAWVLDASHNSQDLANAIDGSLQTRWTTNTTQLNGQWLSIDLGAQQTFNSIDLNTDASSDNYPRGYLVFVSNDGNDWGSPVALAEGESGESSIQFDEVTARFVKVVQTGLSDDEWWSVYELNVSLEDSEVSEKESSVSSLAELQSAIVNSNQSIVMEAGSYDFSDLASNKRELLFSGSNNTIDLKDVYINVPVGSTDKAAYLVMTGSNNSIIGGEFEDTYSSGLDQVTDYVSYNEDSALAYGLKGDPVLAISGDNNLIDGLKLTIRGSFPYGYGSLFGIGSTNSFGLNKRCGIFINGDSNTIENSQVIQRAFCHGIFMQSPADNTTIRNTYVEGALRASNDMLAEDEGSLPYLNGYLDAYGEAIAADEMHSLSEDGIRVYSNGGSVVVENSTVYKMRGGIRLYLASSASVSNSVALDNGSTNWNMPKGGTVTKSTANFTYAPISDFRLSRSYQDLEITIEPSPEAVGSHNIADILGSNHTIVFHRSGGVEDSEETRKIMVYGNNSTILNETEYSIEYSDTSGNTITSAGDVIDNGKNTVIKIDLEIE